MMSLSVSSFLSSYSIRRGNMAAEVSTYQAASILGTSHNTIWERVREGKLPARRQGERRIIRIDVEQLRRYAQENGYRFNEELARSLASEE
jgi:excisionase family DNA binding protein